MGGIAWRRRVADSKINMAEASRAHFTAVRWSLLKESGFSGSVKLEMTGGSGLTMDIAKSLQEKRDEIMALAAKNGAYNVRVFGSIARGEATEASDIDLLVDMEAGRSLLDVAGLLIDLEALLGRKVDVVTTKGLKHSIRDTVLKEAIAL